MIDSKDISVIVQGSVNRKITLKCLQSIRKYLPNAEIILSTWRGEIIQGLPCDLYVFSKDPGAFKYTRSNGTITMNNMNRQTLSTQNGLKRATRKYSLKFRTDLEMTSDNFLKYFSRFKVRNDKYLFFKHRVIISSVFTKRRADDPAYPLLYHPSDWWFFGLTEDLKIYFNNIPLEFDPSFYDNYQYKYPDKKPYLKCTTRCSVEQYYCINAFSKKFKEIDFSDWSCWNKKQKQLSDNLIMNNFIILDFKQHGIKSLKYIGLVEAHNSKHKKKLFIMYQRFKRNYKKYVFISKLIKLWELLIWKK